MTDHYGRGYTLRDLRENLKRYYDLLVLLGFNPEDTELPFNQTLVLNQILLLEFYESHDLGSKFIFKHPIFVEYIEGYQSTEIMVTKHLKATKEDVQEKFGNNFFIEGVRNFNDYQRLEGEWLRSSIINAIVFILNNSALLLAEVIKSDLNRHLKSLCSTEDRLSYLYDYEAEFKHKKSVMHNNLSKALDQFIAIEIEKFVKKRELEVNSKTLQEIESVVKSLKNETESNALCKSLSSSLKNKNFEKVKSDLYELLKRPSYWDISKKEPEKYYHIFVFGLLQFLDFRYEIKSNKESGYGRYDIMLIPLDKEEYGIIFEIKTSDEQEVNYSGTEFTDALEQIDYNEYDTELKSRGVKRILKIALVFTGNKPNITYKTTTV